MDNSIGWVIYIIYIGFLVELLRNSYIKGKYISEINKFDINLILKALIKDITNEWKTNRRFKLKVLIVNTMLFISFNILNTIFKDQNTDLEFVPAFMLTLMIISTICSYIKIIKRKFS